MEKPRVFYLLAALILLSVHPPCRADVPAPPAPPPPPSGYCSTIYDELWGDLQAFNVLLTVPPTWKPVAGGPSRFAANLQDADANTGPGLINAGYPAGVLTELQEEKALGVQAIMIQVGFPALYEPFYGSQANLQPYLDFYSQVAQAVKDADLKLIVENDALLSNDISGGWGSTLNSFYSTLDWNQYMTARATMAATVAETMQPDYLVLAEEPDGEAKNAGQPNMGNPADAAQLISGEIAAVRALDLPKVKLGAGFGSWQAPSGSGSLVNYIAAYVALPLDYIDFHIYPINTEAGASLIDNTLTIASLAAAAGKPVAMSEGWAWKMENSEWVVLTGDFFRGRDPFSFWAPLDAYFLQTVEALAKYTNMLYVAPENPDYLFAYQTYGGTAANGGAANCTCTTESCSDYDIVHAEGPLTQTANSLADYSTTGLSYYSQLVAPPDKTPPSTPSNLTGSPKYTSVDLSWDASTDNVGVAGYNVYRCEPPALGQSCTGIWIANTSSNAYTDTGLAEDTPYNYQVQAFDLANNNSGLAQTFSVETHRVPPNAPSNLVATPVSATNIGLSWSPPQNSSGLSEYLIYAGTSSSNLQQVASTSANATAYNDKSLSPAASYYFGVAAVESGTTSPMSPLVFASTFPLPNPPTSLTATASGNTAIVLTWQENMVNKGLPVSAYQVFRGTASGVLKKVATVESTTFTNESLKPNTTYYYEVVAVDTGNDASAPSSEVSAATP